MKSPKRKVLVLCGPTAAGKTALAVSLAKEFHGQLISADSRQVYAGMDIGTGKDFPANAKRMVEYRKIMLKTGGECRVPVYSFDGIPLWMYDVVKPDEEFHVARYREMAGSILEVVQGEGNLPILVGGTGLYISAVIDGIETANIPPDAALREKLSGYPVQKMQEILQKLDFPVWERMNNSDRNNPRRLVRKIEILQNGGGTFQGKQASEYDVFMIGLSVDAKTLRQRIEARVADRLEHGAKEEIAALLAQGYTFALPSMSAIGYRQWESIFKGSSFDLEALKNAWIREEVQYAKRQMTWFKKDPRIVWFQPTTENYAETVKQAVAKWYNIHT